MGKRLSLSILGVTCGVLLVVTVGIIGWVVVPNIIDDKVKDQTQLTNEETREKWQNVSIPIQLKFYIFNCTNPQAFETGEKFKFVELGPYVYNEARVKDVEFSDDLSNVTYRQKIYYYFDAEASKGTEDDLFTIPNVPLITAAHVSYATNSFIPNMATAIMILSMDGESIFRQKTPVRQLLFDGWQLNPIYSGIGFPDMNFGFYKNRNQSSDGEFVIKTGHENHEEFGKILTWNGQKELSFWNTQGLNPNSSEHFCNKINGSDGSLFPPFISKETTLRIFNTDICRSIWLTFNKETTFKSIPSYKFTIPPEMFAHPDCNGNNQCFCPSQSPRVASQCGQSIIRLFPCKERAPIVSSNPRFLDGGEELFQAIDIPLPERSLHETFIEVEPRSGSLLRASKKVQINVELQYFEPFPIFQNLNFSNLTDSPSIFLPIFWAEELAYMDDSSADDLYEKLVKPVRAVNISRWVIIVIGGLLTLLSTVFLIKACRKSTTTV